MTPVALGLLGSRKFLHFIPDFPNISGLLPEPVFQTLARTARSDVESPVREILFRVRRVREQLRKRIHSVPVPRFSERLDDTVDLVDIR
jgi:hypothetical protein